MAGLWSIGLRIDPGVWRLFWEYVDICGTLVNNTSNKGLDLSLSNDVCHLEKVFIF